MNKLASDYYQLGVQAALQKLAAVNKQISREITRQAIGDAMPEYTGSPLTNTRKNFNLMAKMYNRSPSELRREFVNRAEPAVNRQRDWTRSVRGATSKVPYR